MDKSQTLDLIFSEYIRKRGATHEGYNTCITCGKSLHWKELQCGHYVRRWNSSLRYDPRNCHPQCNECNCVKDGNEAIYRIKLMQKFGKLLVMALESAKNELKQWTEPELDLLILYYRKKVRELDKI